MYTYDEAIKKVLEMRDKLGHIPKEEEYAQERNIAKLEDLMMALNAENYAAVNITVLREIRRRKGKKVYIAKDDNINEYPN